MRYLVLSDSHGEMQNLHQLLDLQITVQGYLHAGDFAQDADFIRHETALPVYAVYGNSDYNRQAYKPDLFLELSGYNIWLTHGHRYLDNNQNIELLLEQAQLVDANIVIFGHTHTPYVHKEANILFLNPGSISRPRNGSYKSFAILDLSQLEAQVEFHSL